MSFFLGEYALTRLLHTRRFPFPPRLLGPEVSSLISGNQRRKIPAPLRLRCLLRLSPVLAAPTGLWLMTLSIWTWVLLWYSILVTLVLLSFSAHSPKPLLLPEPDLSYCLPRPFLTCSPIGFFPGREFVTFLIRILITYPTFCSWCVQIHRFLFLEIVSISFHALVSIYWMFFWCDSLQGSCSIGSTWRKIVSY